MKSLDAKLAEIKANPSSRAFILADAKDADMAFGIRAWPRSAGRRGERPSVFSRNPTRRNSVIATFLNSSTSFVVVLRARGHHVDVRLNEQLSNKEALFRNSQVTPAATNDDRRLGCPHGCYTREPSALSQRRHRSHSMRPSQM
jgi:hypothetical protein